MITSRSRSAAVLAAFIAACFIVLSIAARAQDNNNAAPPPENKPEEHAGPIPADKYYELLIARQELTISSYKQVLKILDANKEDPKAASAALKKHEAERDQKLEQLFQQYGVTADEYYRSYSGTPVQDERAKYLLDHPDVRDQLVKNSRQIESLEKEVWAKMRPLWSQPKKQP